MGKIADELRKKFKSPREAIAALGLDESLLDVKRLALDAKYQDVLAKARAASAKFRQAQADYRARKIGDQEFLVAKREYEESEREFSRARGEDASLTADGALKMPTRLEALALRLTARAVNPLLAFDAKVDYAPVFKGLNTGNFKDRKPKIVTDLKALLKGKTLAADAEFGHVAKMLDQLEHIAEPKSLDESVSEEQHKAMEAAAHGTSNLGIPKDVGKEFSEADKGKTFRDAMPAFLREKGMSEDDIAHCMDMFPGEDEMPENALDETPEQKAEREKKEKEAEDKKAADKAAKDEAEKVEKEKGMDKMVTKDAMNAAIKEAVTGAVDTERKNNVATAEARAFVRPWVGDLSMALDSAEKVFRGAASALGVKNAEKINIEGLRAIIELQPKPGAHPSQHLAQDSARDGENSSGFYSRFPDASRITPA